MTIEHDPLVAFRPLQHARKEGADHPVHRLDVDVEAAVPVLVGTIQHRSVVNPAGDVRQNIDFADTVGIYGNGVVRCDIEGLNRRAIEVIEFRGVDIGREHRSPLGDKVLGDRPPDALPGCGNNRGFSLKPSAHFP